MELFTGLLLSEKEREMPTLEILKEAGGFAIDLLFPPACPVCDRPMHITDKGNCHNECKKILNFIEEPTCFKCGKPIESDDEEVCNLCKSRAYHYDRGLAVFPYRDIGKKMILDLKYNGRSDIAEFLISCAMYMHGAELNRLNADAIIPVPIHKNRFKERGYNQAEVLGYRLAMRLDIPCFNNILIRNKETKAQKQLGNVQRMMNLLDAFSINKNEFLRLKKNNPLNKVILIDDIYTTGSTAECCSLLLKSIGIKEIYLLNVCITHNAEKDDE